MIKYARKGIKKRIPMRKKVCLGLAFVMLLTLVTVPSSSAKGVEYSASGKVFSYQNPDPNASAVVVGGDWNIKITSDGKVSFKLFYKEMNLISEFEGGAPVGSVDQFTMTLIQPDYVEVHPGGCYVSGWFNIDKLAWRPEGSTPPKEHLYNFLGVQYGQIVIVPAGLWVDVGPWALLGSLKNQS